MSLESRIRMNTAHHIARGISRSPLSGNAIARELWNNVNNYDSFYEASAKVDTNFGMKILVGTEGRVENEISYFGVGTISDYGR